ncbi:MAG: protease family protein [Blastocatellia bacterium]|nr:protease family protein [Blastocatellia bacterium]
MQMTALFFNSAGRLRSGFRLIAFTILFFLLLSAGLLATAALLAAILGPRTGEFWARGFGSVVQEGLILVVAIISSWICGRVLEGLPFKAVGWWPHKGWLRDLLLGSLAGGISLVLAAALAFCGGGLHFSFNLSPASEISKTLVTSIGAFLLFGAAEEALFRGYPLQTMVRARLAWVSIILTAGFFANAHLENPNVVAGFTFVNTALAGVWLAVAYLRTRSLWLPLGLHWSWNWTMGAVLGLPVSGISRITPQPLLRAAESGPHWLTGGSYGIEGGAACTVALIISTAWLWKTRTLKASEEMLALSSGENTQPRGIILIAEKEPLISITP